MVVLAPLAVAMAGLKVVSAVSGALGNQGKGTPPVSIPKNQAPKAENYNNNQPKKDPTQEATSGTGTQADPASGIQPRTEQKVGISPEGTMEVGERTPIRGSGFTMNQEDYKKQQGVM